MDIGVGRQGVAIAGPFRDCLLRYSQALGDLGVGEAEFGGSLTADKWLESPDYEL